MNVTGRATVGVMGSSRDPHEGLARPLGELLARLELNLLTGGGRGVMTSVSQAYVESRRGRGISIGILPCKSIEARGVAREGYPNPFVDLPILTHLPFSGIDGQHDLSRNHINILSSDVVVALPGGDGTVSEVALALRYGKRIAAFAALPAQVQHFDPAVVRFSRIAEVERFLKQHIETGESR